MRFLPGNAQHIGARHSQQDSFGFADPEDKAFISHGGFLALVCDGMGGMEYGDAASRTAVRVFLDAYQKKAPSESIPDALERSVREANSQVVALSHSLGMAEGIGTTLVAVALRDRSLYFISVGDSGIFQCAAGQCRMINHPHVFANVLDAAVARGSMSRDDADNHPERESLTSYIGTETLEEIDRNVEPIPMSPGDTVLLASDGMFKTLDPEEIRTSLEGHPQSWPDALVARALGKKREYQDNVTVLSVTLETDEQASMPRTTVLLKPVPVAVAAASPVAAAAAMPMAAPPVASAPLHAPPASQAPVPPPAWTPPPSTAEAVPARSSRGGLWALIVLLVVAAGAVGYWFANHHKLGDLMPAPAPAKEPILKRTEPAPSPILSGTPTPTPTPAETSPTPSPTPTPAVVTPQPTPAPPPTATAPPSIPTTQPKSSPVPSKK